MNSRARSSGTRTSPACSVSSSPPAPPAVTRHRLHRPPQIRLVVPAGNEAAAFIEVRGLGASELDRLRAHEMTGAAWAALLRVTVKADDPSVPTIGRPCSEPMPCSPTRFDSHRDFRSMPADHIRWSSMPRGCPSPSRQDRRRPRRRCRQPAEDGRGADDPCRPGLSDRRLGSREPAPAVRRSSRPRWAAAAVSTTCTSSIRTAAR